MTNIYDRDGQYVAAINKQHKTAQSYRPEEPWLLLFKTGRVDHFDSFTAARREAMKTWPGCRFSKT